MWCKHGRPSAKASKQVTGVKNAMMATSFATVRHSAKIFVAACYRLQCVRLARRRVWPSPRPRAAPTPLRLRPRLVQPAHSPRSLLRDDGKLPIAVPLMRLSEREPRRISRTYTPLSLSTYYSAWYFLVLIAVVFLFHNFRWVAEAFDENF